MTAMALRRWARIQVGACDCAGGCWCEEMRAKAIKHYRQGLRSALAAARKVAGGDVVFHAIRDQIEEAKRALKPT